MMLFGHFAARSQRWLVVAAISFAPSIAFAEDEPTPYQECLKVPLESELSAAKAAFEAGNAAFQEGNYSRALVYWEDAYHRDCTAHAMLLNLARTYELLGQKRHALNALETFLVREPQPENKQQILNRIDELKKSIAGDSQAALATNSPSPPSAHPTPPPPTRNQPSKVQKKPIAPLVVTGVGAAALIGGVVVFVLAGNEAADTEAQCFQRNRCFLDRDGQPRSPQASQDLAEDGNAARSMQTVGAAIAGVGAVAAIGGVVWYALAPRDSRASSERENAARTRVVPMVSRSVSGLAISGNF